jgi:hypothetical protein
MNYTGERLCIWAGPLSVTLFGLGFVVIAGLVPLPAPHASPDQIGHYYDGKTTRVGLGMAVAILGAGLLYPWSAALATQIKRIDGERSALATAQLAGGVGLATTLMLGLGLIACTAYRPDRSPAVLQGMNDLAWLLFVGLVPPVIVQCAATAIAILGDSDPEPRLPRWLGFLNLWAALLFAGGPIDFVVKRGPLV